MSVHIAFDTPQDIKDSVFELVKLVGKEGHGTVKKGANEVTKCAERQTAMMVIMAEDVNPPELLAHIPMICREKNIPFIYVDNQEYLAEDTFHLLGAARMLRTFHTPMNGHGRIER